jgi:hypothetical protein
LSFEPILLAPEAEEEPVYPYRRVWRTSWLEVGTLFLAATFIYAFGSVLEVLPADSRSPRLKLGIALLPFLAWLVFSYRGERRALQPRHGLIGMAILGALVANGVAIPLGEHLFMTERWLPTAGFFGRVIGYTLTLGFTAEFLKYAVLRYVAWPERFQQRLDGIAYALAVSIGYAMVFNVRAALVSDMTLIATALRVASITFSHLATGLIMGFFLAELRIGRPPIFWLPLGLFIASFLSGLYYAFRGVAIVGGLNVESTASSPIRGLALAFGLVAVMFVSFAFVIENADARMEALTGRRYTL